MPATALILLLALALLWTLWRALRSSLRVAANVIAVVLWLALAAGITGLLLAALAALWAAR